MTKPGLFGLKYSNRNFAEANSWGKNQFNSSFPAALVAYMHSKSLPAVLIRSGATGEISHGEVAMDQLLGITPLSEDAFYAFESVYTPYSPYYIGAAPRVDLVVINRNTGQCLCALEIKLTALPDNSTCLLCEEDYSSELVIRPDTISYLACSIITQLGSDEINHIVEPLEHIADWADERSVIEQYALLNASYQRLGSIYSEHQRPLLLQPVWKTQGKSPCLSEHCLDTFVWTDLSLLNLAGAFSSKTPRRIGRHERTLVWLMAMLQSYALRGQFDADAIIDTLSYNTKNDKAFASSGYLTHPFLASPYLSRPRVKKEEIKYIILGGGQNLLSPERRFDAIIYNSPELFN